MLTLLNICFNILLVSQKFNIFIFQLFLIIKSLIKILETNFKFILKINKPRLHIFLLNWIENEIIVQLFHKKYYSVLSPKFEYILQLDKFTLNPITLISIYSFSVNKMLPFLHLIEKSNSNRISAITLIS